MKVREILSQLVSIDSVSSRSNVEIVKCLESYCETVGFKLTRFPYADDCGREKVTLVATVGAGSADDIELALVGHTDTVPYDAEWVEALNLIERDDKLYAVGACDTKGFIAAAITAVSQINVQTLTKPLALIFTSDEEVGLVGAKQLASMRPFRVRRAIVGEPTSLQPKRAGKGYCLAEVTVHGRGAHSAHPNLGISAIFGAAALVRQIETISEILTSDCSADFDPPYTTLNVGLIDGGNAKNTIADQCRFTLEWRPIPEQRNEHVLDLVKEAVRTIQQSNPDFTCDINVTRIDAGFTANPDSEFVRLIETLSGQPSGTIAFSSEARQLVSLGAETVVIGPGDIRVAHRTGEYVPIDQLNDCVTLLKESIRQCCS